MVVKGYVRCVMLVGQLGLAAAVCSGQATQRNDAAVGFNVNALDIKSSDTSAADDAWKLVDKLISFAPARQGARAELPLNLLQLIHGWEETSWRLLRETGLLFYDRYPNDPRRWKWVVATIDFPPLYYSDMRQVGTFGPLVAFDTIAQKSWNERRPKIIAELMASSQPTALQKAQVALRDLRDREGFAYDNAVALKDRTKYNLTGWGNELLVLANQYHNVTNPTIRDNITRIARGVVRFAKRDSVVGPAIIGSLRNSSNMTLRTYVSAEVAMDDARRVPMQMRFKALDGRVVDLVNLRGKVVLIDFGAYTWCSICRTEERKLMSVYQKYKNQGFAVVGFALENDPEDSVFVARYVKEHGVEWPIYFEGRGMQENEYVQKFGLTGAPNFMLLDKNGLLVKYQGGSGSIGRLAPVIEQLLGITSAGSTLRSSIQ